MSTVCTQAGLLSMLLHGLGAGARPMTDDQPDLDLGCRSEVTARRHPEFFPATRIRRSVSLCCVCRNLVTGMRRSHPEHPDNTASVLADPRNAAHGTGCIGRPQAADHKCAGKVTILLLEDSQGLICSSQIHASDVVHAARAKVLSV